MRAPGTKLQVCHLIVQQPHGRSVFIFLHPNVPALDCCHPMLLRHVLAILSQFKLCKDTGEACARLLRSACALCCAGCWLICTPHSMITPNLLFSMNSLVLCGGAGGSDFTRDLRTPRTSSKTHISPSVSLLLSRARQAGAGAAAASSDKLQ